MRCSVTRFQITRVAVMLLMASSSVTSAASVPPVTNQSGMVSFENETTPSKSYDAQFEQLIRNALKAAQASDSKVSEQDTNALKAMADDFASHRMLLKNAVYRAETKYIRITFADANDKYVVKGTYGTSSDGVLTNSKYADKSKLIDLKIMYLPNGGTKYRYLHIMDIKPSAEAAKYGQKPMGVLDTKLDNETCKYCHRIAEYSGSPSGLFFRRYQYESTANPLKVTGMFDADAFVHESQKPNWAPATMTAGDLYISMKNAIPVLPVVRIKTRQDERPDFQKVRHNMNFILETPELLEVLAKDNGKSYCAGFSGIGGPPGFVSYVCADMRAKTMYVDYYSQTQQHIEYTKPFYGDPREAGMGYAKK